MEAEKLSNHHQLKKQALLKQITLYKQKISQYQFIQKQLEQLQDTISKKNTTTIKPSNNLKNQSQISTHSHTPQTVRRSASKKVKVYELQKKVAKISKQYREKYVTNTKCFSEDNQILQRIKQIDFLIKNEKKLNHDLKKTQIELNQEIENIQQQTNQEKRKYQEHLKIINNYQFQKKRLKDSIFNIKKKLKTKQKSQQTQPDQEEYKQQPINMTMSLSDSENENEDKIIQRSKLTINPLKSKFNKNKNEQQIQWQQNQNILTEQNIQSKYNDEEEGSIQSQSQISHASINKDHYENEGQMFLDLKKGYKYMMNKIKNISNKSLVCILN